MKNLFKGHYSSIVFDEKALKNKIIVFEDEALCCLLGIPHEYAKQIIELLKTHEKQYWLPYVIADRYHKLLYITIEKNFRSLQDVLYSLNQVNQKIRTIPYEIDRGSNFQRAVDSLMFAVQRRMVELRDNIKKNSEVKNAIADLFKKRVGSESMDSSAESFEVSELEYLNVVGAIDESTKTEVDTKRRNNLAVLQSLVNLSKAKDKDIIYVVKQLSIDWNNIANKTSYGPRHDLQTYFYNESKHEFFCITLHKLISILNEKPQIVKVGAFQCLANITYNQEFTVVDEYKTEWFKKP